MNVFWKTVAAGAWKGVKTGGMLLKIMLPIYLVVVVIKYSPVMPFLERVFEPGMGVFRLPGDAIVPIVAGLFTDEYGALAAMESFDFSMVQITAVAMMVLTAHSLPVESALARKIGFPPVRLAVLRLAAAVVAGLLVGQLGALLSAMGGGG